MIKLAKNEIVKPVKGFEDFYLISNMGKLFSLSTRKQMTIFEDNKGYCKVTLTKRINEEKIRKTTGIHRIIAEAFIPNPENKPQVNHIDGNKSNNSIENLEWVTAKENITHAWENDLVGKNKKYISDSDLIGKIFNSKKDGKYIVDRYYKNINGVNLFVVKFINSNNEKIANKYNIINEKISDLVYFINNEYILSDEIKKILIGYNVNYKTVMTSIMRKNFYKNDTVFITKAINYKIEEENI